MYVSTRLQKNAGFACLSPAALGIVGFLRFAVLDQEELETPSSAATTDPGFFTRRDYSPAFLTIFNNLAS